MYAYPLGRVECRKFGVIPSGLSPEGNLHLHWLEMVCRIALSLFGLLLRSLQYKLSKLTNLPTSHLKNFGGLLSTVVVLKICKLWLVSKRSTYTLLLNLLPSCLARYCNILELHKSSNLCSGGIVNLC